ncbi:hypothetical protein, partial [Weissella cibaria]|uniref:hypothetical protein n=1 Tax=Weissella cibaria TaxID=137591 RepID=UPI00215AF30B
METFTLENRDYLLYFSFLSKKTIVALRYMLSIQKHRAFKSESAVLIIARLTYDLIVASSS